MLESALSIVEPVFVVLPSGISPLLGSDHARELCWPGQQAILHILG